MGSKCESGDESPHSKEAAKPKCCWENKNLRT